MIKLFVKKLKKQFIRTIICNVMKWYYKNLIKWIKNGCDKVIGNSVIMLNISDNNLMTLPPEIGKLINLQIFYCGYNNLTTLTPEISNLINL